MRIEGRSQLEETSPFLQRGRNERGEASYLFRSLFSKGASEIRVINLFLEEGEEEKERGKCWTIHARICRKCGETGGLIIESSKLAEGCSQFRDPAIQKLAESGTQRGEDDEARKASTTLCLQGKLARPASISFYLCTAQFRVPRMQILSKRADSSK